MNLDLKYLPLFLVSENFFEFNFNEWTCNLHKIWYNKIIRKFSQFRTAI